MTGTGRGPGSGAAGTGMEQEREGGRERERERERGEIHRISHISEPRDVAEIPNDSHLESTLFLVHPVALVVADSSWCPPMRQKVRGEDGATFSSIASPRNMSKVESFLSLFAKSKHSFIIH